MKIAVTGASGFVGRALLPELVGAGHAVNALSRGRPGQSAGAITWFQSYGEDGLRNAFDRCDSVVHLAAKVHDTAGQTSAAEYSDVNVRLSENVATAAIDAGVKRVVLVSTVKTFAESTMDAGAAFRASDKADPYGQTKLRAEATVQTLLQGTGVDAVVLRFPLVYGPGMRANMLALADAVRRGTHIPTPRPPNARSVLYIGNATAAIRAAVEHPGEESGVFVVTDGAPLSTEDIASGIAAGMGVQAQTIAVPAWFARSMGRVAGALGHRGRRIEGLMERVLGSLGVDHPAFTARFGFTPPFTSAEGLQITGEWARARADASTG